MAGMGEIHGLDQALKWPNPTGNTFKLPIPFIFFYYYYLNVFRWKMYHLTYERPTNPFFLYP